MNIIEYDLELTEEKIPTLIPITKYDYQTNSNLDSPEKITNMFNEIFRLNKKAEEYVYATCLDTKLNAISVFNVSKGTVNTAFSNPREILIRALISGAVNMVLTHNHPSGCSEPSKEDIQIYKKIKHALKIIGVDLIDSITIGKDGYCSIRQRLEC